MILRTVRKSLSQRRFWKTVSGTCAACAAATSSAASADDGANGLSTTTATPLPMARFAYSTCVLFGVATTMRSRSSSNSSSAVTILASGCAARACACRSGFAVTIATRSMPSVEEISGAWKTRPAMP